MSVDRLAIEAQFFVKVQDAIVEDVYEILLDYLTDEQLGMVIERIDEAGMGPREEE